MWYSITVHHDMKSKFLMSVWPPDPETGRNNRVSDPRVVDWLGADHLPLDGWTGLSCLTGAKRQATVSALRGTDLLKLLHITNKFLIKWCWPFGGQRFRTMLHWHFTKETFCLEVCLKTRHRYNCWPLLMVVLQHPAGPSPAIKSGLGTSGLLAVWSGRRGWLPWIEAVVAIHSL